MEAKNYISEKEEIKKKILAQVKEKLELQLIQPNMYTTDSIVNMGSYYLLSPIIINIPPHILEIGAVFTKDGKPLIDVEDLLQIRLIDENTMIVGRVIEQNKQNDGYSLRELPTHEIRQVTRDGRMTTLLRSYQNESIVKVECPEELKNEQLAILTLDDNKKYLYSYKCGETLSEGFDDISPLLGMLEIHLNVRSNFCQDDNKRTTRLTGYMDYSGNMIPLTADLSVDPLYFDFTDRSRKISAAVGEMNRETWMRILALNSTRQKWHK